MRSKWQQAAQSSDAAGIMAFVQQRTAKFASVNKAVDALQMQIALANQKRQYNMQMSVIKSQAHGWTMVSAGSRQDGMGSYSVDRNVSAQIPASLCLVE
jgi:hypothetical protein